MRLADENVIGQTRSVHKPFKIVVAGGFASGKSTLINRLLHEDVLERHVGYRRSPLLRLVGSQDTSACFAIDASGNRSAIGTVDHAFDDPDAAVVEQTSTLAALNGMEIIEYPASEVGEISLEHLPSVEDADLLIWCTIGSQAWRLSEKTALRRLRDRFSGKVILAVTRSDLFRSQEDRNKVRKRLDRELAGIADEIVFVGAPGQGDEALGKPEQTAAPESPLDHLVYAYREELARLAQAHAAASSPGTGSGVPEIASPEIASPEIASNVIELVRPRRAANVVVAAPAEMPTAEAAAPEVADDPEGQDIAADVAGSEGDDADPSGASVNVASADTTEGLAFADLLEALSAQSGVLSAGVIDPDTQSIVAGSASERSAGLYLALCDLPDEKAGEMEHVIATTASGYLVFQRLGGASNLAVAVRYGRQGVVISSAVSKLREICAEHDSPGKGRE